MKINIDRTAAKDVTIYISGRLDTQASPELEKAIAPLLTEQGLNITVDIGEMAYISSSGVRCFVLILRSTNKNGGKLTVQNTCPEIRDVFNMTGLSSLFGIK